MFDRKIQSYINTSGEAAAMTRAKQLENYISSVYQNNANNNVNVKDVKEFGSKPFNQVLESSARENAKPVFSIDAPPNIPFGALSVGSKIHSPNSVASVSPKSAKVTTRSEIMNMIDKACEKYNVDSKLVKALVKQESGFNPSAKSKVGAMGLMQLMPQTAESLGVKNPMNPEENIDGGVRYLKQMLDKFHGNKILALAAYNAGPNAVAKYNGVPPYSETQNYVKSILGMYL